MPSPTIILTFFGLMKNILKGLGSLLSWLWQEGEQFVTRHQGPPT